MIFSVPVLAATSPTAQAVVASTVAETVADAAAAENKTVGEYMNNAVTEVPGLDEATPLGQGGHVIINGAPSNQTFSVLKPERGTVDSAKVYAENLGGKVLNVKQQHFLLRTYPKISMAFPLLCRLNRQCDRYFNESQCSEGCHIDYHMIFSDFGNGQFYPYTIDQLINFNILCVSKDVWMFLYRGWRSLFFRRFS